VTGEVRYDAADQAPLLTLAPDAPAVSSPTAEPVDGFGCHAPAGQMAEAARAAGQSEILDQFAKDYPQGPHDKPQSMCPAFGSLRVGLRMRRVATVLSGSACCVYGLTFVSHFYGARRSVGYVPFNSESWLPASCSRISATRCMNSPIPTAMTRWW
jgi:3,8-divinyl chlorophyllide a/chlorophyllide a reductase subunit Y